MPFAQLSDSKNKGDVKRMNVNYENEFGTVDLLLKSNFETRGVDSFCIALIKVERQLRRIFTYLIFQHRNYSNREDVKELRDILSHNRRMYFDNFIIGIDIIYCKTVRDIYGGDYVEDYKLLKEFTKDRNKIFHGQLTKDRLKRKELIERVNLMMKWSKQISISFNDEVGFDGFQRNSFRKSKKELKLINCDEFSTIEKYKQLLKEIERK